MRNLNKLVELPENIFDDSTEYSVSGVADVIAAGGPGFCMLVSNPENNTFEDDNLYIYRIQWDYYDEEDTNTKYYSVYFIDSPSEPIYYYEHTQTITINTPANHFGK